ncbi:FAD dependent oxidoreductase [Alteromonadaceae bacterium 2753L.S.0a.02]|nr:FAD dependent oxidoreductase [Alteromonadaceae bacterium 2753L.S.0a.02]
MYRSISLQSPAKIAVIGGGIAGATIALRLSELGIDTTLFEKSDGLVSGPPICHLHAGGNLYREISDQQCLALLRQSIDTLKVYQQCVNWRPTVITLPVWDKNQPESLLPRLNLLQKSYAALVKNDPSNRVLGDPNEYFQIYYRDQLQALARRPLPETPCCSDDWMIPVAKHLDFSKIQFPVYLVQEYGLSAFRFAATAQLAMEKLPQCHLKLQHKVIAIQQHHNTSKRWLLSVENSGACAEQLEFDYLINACGFKSGEIDDMLALPRQRLVEFKAAYVAKWSETEGQWPEVIFHGERGTPQGMAQLTPYPGGYYQLHGMTDIITLFKDGLVSSNTRSAQPKLADHHLDKIERSWLPEEMRTRTEAAIAHVAQFLPHFKQATLGAKPLFGAQQIPGDDPSLRAADVSFDGEGYARTEIVKASSALAAADAVLQNLIDTGVVDSFVARNNLRRHFFPVVRKCSDSAVTKRAFAIARQRHYPEALAQQIQAISPSNGTSVEKSSTTASGSYTAMGSP